VSRLRAALGRDVIETTPGGYRLNLEARALDADRFEELYRLGAELSAAGDAVRARDVLV
jgi:hypothetical protein